MEVLDQEEEEDEEDGLVDNQNDTEEQQVDPNRNFSNVSTVSSKVTYFSLVYNRKT